MAASVGLDSNLHRVRCTYQRRVLGNQVSGAIRVRRNRSERHPLTFLACPRLIERLATRGAQSECAFSRCRAEHPVPRRPALCRHRAIQRIRHRFALHQMGTSWIANPDRARRCSDSSHASATPTPERRWSGFDPGNRCVRSWKTVGPTRAESCRDRYGRRFRYVCRSHEPRATAGR